MPDHRSASTELKPIERPPRVIGRQLAVGFGLIALISVSMCAMLLATIGEVSAIVEHMRRDESAIRGGLELSKGVREQYIHIAHSLLEGDRSHLEHYGKWLDRLHSDADAQSVDVPSEVTQRLQIVKDNSREMDRLFREVLLPAAERGEFHAVQSEHERTEHLAAQAAAQADAVAMYAERRMAAEHDRAGDTVRTGIVLGIICVIAVVIVAVGYTVRLREAVLRPLASLTRAAGKFGRGQFHHRIGAVGSGELRELATAFDRMAEELAVRESELIKKERMAAIGRLAAGVAHEINNPIGIIRGYLKTMLPEAPSDQLREELAVLDEEADVCQRLTRDLLDYAEVPRIVATPIQMRDFLVNSARRLEGTSQVGDHVIAVDAEDATIDADAARLRQVFANLVANAAHASKPGTPITVTGAADTQGGYVLEVADSGPGVDARDRARIFEPFFSTRRGGSGLGLSVCRGIVASHGGTIEVTPTPGGGATFRVRLPAQPPTSHEELARA